MVVGVHRGFHETVLTIASYHYVRDAGSTAFPRLKAASLAAFEGQLDYFARHYALVSGGDVIAACCGSVPLPSNACWLTFDDGLSDHVRHVLPRLHRRRLPASFFPTVLGSSQQSVLAVHKVQFIRAAVADHALLKRSVLDEISAYRAAYGLPSDDTLYARHARERDRFDPPDVVFVKRLLQDGLPDPVRSRVLDALFARFVTADEADFAHELYMSATDVAELHDVGMQVGGHGQSHRRLDRLTAGEQAAEIAATRVFLETVGVATAHEWVMCYPHGGYDETTLRLLGESGCVVGLGIARGLVDHLTTPLELPRLDTNEFPVSRDAEAVEWTCRVTAASREPCS